MNCRQEKQRHSVSLPRKLSGRLRQLTRSRDCDMSQLIADAVTAVYQTGPEYVMLRSSARGMQRMLGQLYLVANHVHRIQVQVASGRTDATLAGTLHRTILLAKIGHIAAQMDAIYWSVANWRRQIVRDMSIDMSAKLAREMNQDGGGI